MVTPPIFIFVPYHNAERKNPSLFSKRWRKIIQHDTALHGYSISDPQAAQLHLHSMASTLENPYNQHHCLAPGLLAKAQQCRSVSILLSGLFLQHATLGSPKTCIGHFYLIPHSSRYFLPSQQAPALSSIHVHVSPNLLSQTPQK